MSGEPKNDIRNAAVLSLLVAAMAIVVGLFLQFRGTPEDFGSPNAGWGMVFSGAIVAILAWFIHRASRIAIGLALLMVLADTVLTIPLWLETGIRPGIGGLILRVVFVFALGRAFLAATRLRKQTSTG